MKENKFENIILQGGDERNLANTGNDQMDIDEMSMSKQKMCTGQQCTEYIVGNHYSKHFRTCLYCPKRNVSSKAGIIRSSA